jgi:Tol biopolymer transport system component
VGALETGVTQLAWAPDGTELVYTSGLGNLQTMLILDPADGNARVIDSRRRLRVGLGFTRQGRWVCAYTTALAGREAEAHECVDREDGSLTTLATQAACCTLGWVGGPAVTPDSLIAYSIQGPVCVAGIGGSTCDSLYLYNLRTQSRQLLAIGLPVTFAPSGKQLLYLERPCVELSDINTCRLFIWNLAGGGTTEIWAGPSTDIFQVTRWDAEGVRRLVVAKGELVDTLVLRDLTRRTTQSLHVLQRSEMVMPAPTLSADGTTAAYWLVEELPTQTLSHLFVVNLRTGASREVALGLGFDTGYIALSPDGGRVAYVFESQGYWSDLHQTLQLPGY